MAYCDEEGMVKGRPFNAKATKAWHKYLESTGKPYYPLMAMLYGPVIIVQSLPKTVTMDYPAGLGKLPNV